MPFVEYLITGGGAAGLGLAYALVHSPLSDRRILIVEQDEPACSNRSWLYWTSQPTPFDHLACRSWDKIRVAAPGFERLIPMENYRLHLLRGMDFYRQIRAELATYPNVGFIQAEVQPTINAAGVARLKVHDEVVTAFWAFDSALRPGEWDVNPVKHHDLKLHCTAWDVEGKGGSFTPDTPTLFEFTLPQNGALRWFTLLPLSEKQALIRCSTVSPDSQPPVQEEVDWALRDYLQNQSGIKEYSACRMESGTLPMTDFPFPRRDGMRIMNIGIKGGRVKPSTGFAFRRIQDEASHIADSLVRKHHPFNLPMTSHRYAVMDTILLQLMLRRPRDYVRLFTCLFRKNPIARILGFWDEENPFLQDLRLLATLPLGPVIRAAIKVFIFGRI